MQANMENGALLTEMADKALLNYDIEVVSKQLIRHNENQLTVKMGALQQTLHAHSQKWVPPAGFRRLIYDETTIVQACDNLGKGIQSGIIGNDDYRIVCDVTKLICSLFANTPKTKASWGLVHADFLSGNLLIREGQLIPIDFSLSGWAYYLLDPAICLCNLKKHLRKAFIEGYGLQLTEERLYFIEALTLYIILVAASRQINNIVWKSWFEKRFPVITGEFCQKLQRHISFIYDI